MSDPTDAEISGDLPAENLGTPDELGTFSDPWASLLTHVGLALVVITVIDALAVVAHGLSLPARVGPLLRVGFAFGTNVNKDSLGWIGLLLAVLLVSWPAFAGIPTTERQDRVAALTIAVATGFALLIALAALMGVIANVRLYDLAGRPLDAGVKRELAMFAFRRVATSGLIVFAGVRLVRLRFPRPDHAQPVA